MSAMLDTGDVIGPPASTPSLDAHAPEPAAIGSMRCRPKGSPNWLIPPRLNVAMQPSLMAWARWRYFGDAASSLFSTSMVAFETTQMASTVAEPTGAGNCAVQISPSGATTRE